MWVPKKDVNITFYRPLMTIIRVLHFELAGFSISFARRPRQRQQSSNTYALNTHRQPSNQPASIYFILLLFFSFHTLRYCVFGKAYYMPVYKYTS